MVLIFLIKCNMHKCACFHGINSLKFRVWWIYWNGLSFIVWMPCIYFLSRIIEEEENSEIITSFQKSFLYYKMIHIWNFNCQHILSIIHFLWQIYIPPKEIKLSKHLLLLDLTKLIQPLWRKLTFYFVINENCAITSKAKNYAQGKGT